MKTQKSVLAAMVFCLLGHSARADGGVEFVPVPVDVSKNCSAVILKGTQRFKGIGFVTPKVFLSVNKNRERLFEIIPLDGGQYLIRMGLYIPLDASSAKTYRQNDSELYVNTCDFDQIRVALAKKTKTDMDPIVTLAPLPIRKLEVSLDGLNKPYVIGTDATDLLDYLGMDQVVEFRVNKSELKEIISRLNGGFGLGMKVAMFFKARSTSGFIDVKIDQKKVEKALEASLKGRVKVAYADLSASVKSVLQNLNINVYQEGDDQAMNQLVTQIMNQFLGNHPEAVAEEQDQPAKTDATNTDEKTPKGKNLVDVKVFLSFMKTEVNLNLKYQKMGAEEDRNFLTSTIIRADVQELSTRIHRIGSKERKTSLPYFMATGNRITMSVTGKCTEKLLSLKVAKDQPLSKDELLNNFGTLSRFPKLSKMGRGDINSLDVDAIGGASLYEYPNTFWTALGVLGSVNGFNWALLPRIKRTQWNMITRVPVYDLSAMETPFEMTEDAMKTLPLKFVFGNVGSRKFSMMDLFQKNPYFNAQYDSFGQKIVFKALQPLGLITVYDEENVPVKSVVLKSYVETTRSLLSDSKKSSYLDAGKENVPAYQNYYMIRVDQSQGANSYLVKPRANESSSSGMLSIPPLH